jgi:type I restriction enzyme, S subunit
MTGDTIGEWREETLGDVLTLQRGFDLPARSRVDGPFPVVSSSGITGRHAVAKVDPPGVVIGRYGSLGLVHWITEPYWPLNTSLWVKNFKGNYPRYVSYLLRTVNADGSAASAVPGVNRNHLHRLPVRVPSVGSQRRIAAVLAAFDELIEINDRRIELLEDLVRSLYREWFVQFRFPGHESVALYESEVGLIPEGWTTVHLGDLATLRYGKALPAARRKPGPYAVVSSAGVVDEHDETLVPAPGIVIGRKGNVGSVWWIDRAFFPIDTTYYVETLVPLGLMYWQLRHLAFIDSHAAVPGLSREQATSLLVLSVDRSLAQRFDEIHQACFDVIAALRSQNGELVATRDLLLPRLVSGRLDISDIDLGDLLPAEAA